MFKNEAPWLKEWIVYHHNVLGINRFYLYNNDSTDNYREVLQPFIDQGIVELIDWDSANPAHHLGNDLVWMPLQVGAFNDCLKNRALGQAKWLAVIDIDEFIVPTKGVNQFYSLLDQAEKRKKGALCLSWRVFGTSNVEDLAPGDLLTEKLIWRANDDFPWHQAVKSLYRPEGVASCGVHIAAKMNPNFGTKTLDFNEVRIHHYWARTNRFGFDKRKESFKSNPNLLQELHQVQDDSILQYIPLFKDDIRNASLEASHGIRESKVLDRDIKKLYDNGKSGKVIFIPGSGHRIIWHPPGEKTAVYQINPKKTAVTIGSGGGRLGDQLLSYFHARWIAYRDQVPFIYKPFMRDAEFALSQEPRISIDGPVEEIPFFPEFSWKNPNPLFFVDWDDPGFRELIAKCLTPTKPHHLLKLPSDRITVCVHIRRDDAIDAPLVYQTHPLKFPPDEFFIEQIQTIAHIFQGKPLYIFIMTNAAHPETIVQHYQHSIKNADIQWDYRKSPPESDLDDFFSIPLFDCLIYGDSNFSIIASKLSEYAIQISPSYCTNRKNIVRIVGVDIKFNPLFKKFEKYSDF